MAASTPKTVKAAEAALRAAQDRVRTAQASLDEFVQEHRELGNRLDALREQKRQQLEKGEREVVAQIGRQIGELEIERAAMAETVSMQEGIITEAQAAATAADNVLFDAKSRHFSIVAEQHRAELVRTSAEHLARIVLTERQGGFYAMIDEELKKTLSDIEAKASQIVEEQAA
jgi:hypothetical protein